MGRMKKKTWALLLAAAVILCVGGFALRSAILAGTDTPNLPESMETQNGTEQGQPEDSRAAAQLRISEVMLRNKATLPDEDGDFSDWVELENISGDAVSLSGWRMTDGEEKPSWPLPEITLAPGERRVFFLSGKDREEHASFSLAEGETLLLLAPGGAEADRFLCPESEADRSWQRDGDGEWAESLYPTPGCSNDAAGYDAWQESLATDSPLVIYEAVVYNDSDRWTDAVDHCDWIELKNISQEPVELSEYYLSDKAGDRLLFRLPERTLAPGELFLLRCSQDKTTAGTAPLCDAFSLDSSSDRLYLSRKDGSLADYASLRGIPYGGSFGRMPDRAGWFYFAAPTPGMENGTGCRRISAMPAAGEADGIFNDVESVAVTLSGSGEIHYTTDGSYPTVDSPLYDGPITLTETGIVRAIALEDGALPSRALTLSYIINENHSLPVVSLVSDNARFQWMYSDGKKGVEVPGSLSFYEEGGSFTLPCGIKMHGETSLDLPKKNMSVRFRGAYGQEELSYDLFGGGVTAFNNLLLRAGQDYYHAIIRNELCTELALKASDRVITSRSRYCVLYIDGKYAGIYALGEKLNEAMYAHYAGVSRDSVTVETPPLYASSPLYHEVFVFAKSNDLSDPENYAVICQMLDVDSLVDWLLLEGIFANDDLSFGNVRYCRSTENDGKWRLMLYDLDSSFYSEDNCFTNLLSPWAQGSRQVAELIGCLLESPDFRDRVLKRAAELLDGPLSNEAILEEIDVLSAQIEPEVERDYARYQMYPDGWEWNVDWIRNFITENDWNQVCIDRLCEYLKVTPEERAAYFGR